MSKELVVYENVSPSDVNTTLKVYTKRSKQQDKIIHVMCEVVLDGWRLCIPVERGVAGSLFDMRHPAQQAKPKQLKVLAYGYEKVLTDAGALEAC